MIWGGLESDRSSKPSGELLTITQIEGRNKGMNQGGGSLPRPNLIANSLFNEDSRKDLRASE